ncbi:InlB B-repeat-containing protein [Nocardia seriolae]|uniref:InlB B-repeat-containing protein n=1 Tax=Nocardia seriolae TaxID=37332 RepID=UPI0006903E97|nr:hypothetical protein [Nocardia seriolae]MTJ63771.1 hypothetical protein [Nocardia seriolae]MTJ74002.1 hypothetical protein [Nocardia seriolae]MTJ88335.1 hypothetical protein [Nocardia seriolae]MTK32320.1 hypothetical protein [Nocardia seriolae]MTK41659.1 hypothetical protein [Nocardia seriolae]
MSRNPSRPRSRHLLIAALLIAAPELGLPSPATVKDTAQLQIWFDGWGGGTVTSSPAGINCHQSRYDWQTGAGGQITGTCAISVPAGTSVTLTARPDPDSYFNLWDQGDTPTITRTVSGSSSATVVFCPNDDLCSAAY